MIISELLIQPQSASNSTQAVKHGITLKLDTMLCTNENSPARKQLIKKNVLKSLQDSDCKTLLRDTISVPKTPSEILHI